MLSNNKIDKLENILMPRPLFDKTNAALIKLRRDIKTQKLKGWPNYKLDVIKSSLSIQPDVKFNRDDWLPNDDFIVLHVIYFFIFFLTIHTYNISGHFLFFLLSIEND